MNLAVIRGEIKRSQKELYKLDPKSDSLPDLTSEEGLMEWGQNIIDGENQRTAAGGFAIYNPTINKVKVHYEMFKEDYTSHQLHKRTHSRVFEDEQKAAQKREKANKRNNRKDDEAPVMSTPIEKTTLGDIEELAALKEKLSGK